MADPTTAKRLDALETLRTLLANPPQTTNQGHELPGWDEFYRAYRQWVSECRKAFTLVERDLEVTNAT